MTAFFFKNVPDYRMQGFSAVRDAFDNLYNVLHLVEIVNTSMHCMLEGYDKNFDFVIFSGDYNRALVRKNDGFFTMSIPFQIIDHEDQISFNFDPAGMEVSGQFISVIRNAILTCRDHNISCDEITISISESFGLDVSDAIIYCDAFISLLADDHGYFRFDDDPKNANEDIHPRYHFDFFYKNSSSIKIGSEEFVDIECFYALFDKTYAKRYLRI